MLQDITKSKVGKTVIIRFENTLKKKIKKEG